VKREVLYNTHVIAGIIFLFLPLIITALVSWIIIASLGIDSVSILNILTWLGISLLFNLLFFMTSVATGMFTGMSLVQGALSYILLILPTGLLHLLLHNMNIHTYGFAYSYYSHNISFSPLIRLIDMSSYTLQAGEITAYILVSIGLYGAGRYLYKRRKLETAGNAIAFDILSPVFKYAATLCTMLLFGTYFYGAQNESIGWTYFGYLLGAVLAYFLCEILLNKSLRVFKPRIFKGLGAYTLVSIILIAGLNYDGIGYEKRLPVLDEVESVYMDSSFYPLFRDDPQLRVIDSESGAFYPQRPTPVYIEAQNIANIHALHRKIIDGKSLSPGNNSGDNRRLQRLKICLAYNLKNGQQIYREYTIPVPAYADFLKTIHESHEYKVINYVVLRIDPAIIKMININVPATTKNVRISDQEKINEAIDALQRDTLNQTYEEMNSRQPEWANIELLIDTKYSMHMNWNKSSINFEQWLKKNGLYNQARIMPDADIDYAIVDINPDLTSDDERAMMAKPTRQLIIQELENLPGVLKITEPDRLEICLRNFTYSDQETYKVFFVLKNGNLLSGGFSEADAPDFIKAHFPASKTDYKMGSKNPAQ
ncbi:MAG: DUF6449 domain-containing protein, partial [Syntrophomonas sp.]|nr:DUF6449 domain-containing protein [Syntrophomonas sp.]